MEQQHRLSLGYDQGHRTNLSLTEPSGSWSQSYAYDAESRMTNITSPAGSFAYAYATPNPASALISGIALPNGASVANAYDTLGRLTGTALANQFGHVLDGYVYGLDVLGLRTNITRNLGLTTNTVAIGYDAIDQLTNWSGRESGGTLRHNEQLAYGYDASGNLRTRTNDALVQTFTVDSLNQISNVTRTGPLTFTGATPVPAADVIVNGVAAQTYGDFTFASTNNILGNGNNTFGIWAQDTATITLAFSNAFTVNLPINVTFQYDANGNLTNDGTRVFAYDAENQLTNVLIPGLWRVGFVFDGLNRRRICREYTWQGSGWLETNEIHYIYDGKLVLQERDPNNNPMVTYTRGLDLSLSLQGAGGIGGMLARTDSNGSAFYHADASGNVTALIDGYQDIVARYRYDGYGKLLGRWGALAEANHYRFSSMEYFSSPGIYGYPRRFYEPNFQRWLNRDPFGESGGINLYAFDGGNPLNQLDPFGLCWSDNFAWLTGPGAWALDQINNTGNLAAGLADQMIGAGLSFGGDVANSWGADSVGGTLSSTGDYFSGLGQNQASTVNVLASQGYYNSSGTPAITADAALAVVTFGYDGILETAKETPSLASQLEELGGGVPISVPTSKGAPQFIFPNGMVLRFDLQPGQYLPGQGPHMNLQFVPGWPNQNIHIPLAN